MSKRKVKVPKDETKREKFKRIVEPRVRKALKTIRLIGNCAGSAYEYTPQDIAYILGALRGASDSLESRFQSKGVQDIEFDLD